MPPCITVEGLEDVLAVGSQKSYVSDGQMKQCRSRQTCLLLCLKTN